MYIQTILPWLEAKKILILLSAVINIMGPKFWNFALEIFHISQQTEQQHFPLTFPLIIHLPVTLLPSRTSHFYFYSVLSLVQNVFHFSVIQQQDCERQFKFG